MKDKCEHKNVVNHECTKCKHKICEICGSIMYSSVFSSIYAGEYVCSNCSHQVRYMAEGLD